MARSRSVPVSTATRGRSGSVGVGVGIGADGSVNLGFFRHGAGTSAAAAAAAVGSGRRGSGGGLPPTGRSGGLAPGEAASGGGSSGGGDSTMQVFVRVRPLAEGEVAESDNMRSLKLLPDGRSIYIRDRFVDEKVLEFSKIFGPEATQQEVFADVGTPACEASLRGQYGTIIAYGQTGTGKTYTAFSTEEGREGLMHRSVHELFAAVEADPSHDYSMSVQYLQLYREQLSDLLDERGLVEVREDADKGVYVKGATNMAVTSPEQALALFARGNSARVVRLTTMNAQSSRSHALFCVSVVRKSRTDPCGPVLYGKLTLVDLAGSERIKRTKADSLRRQEAQAINMSLSCLGSVIHALTDRQATHVPYRSCKLTRILRDSLGEHGNASIVVTVSPALTDVAETLGSLYFGSRALCVRQTNRVHTVPHAACTVPAADLRQKLTELTLGKHGLEDQIESLTADNDNLREAATADGTLIEELTTHLQSAKQRQDTELDTAKAAAKKATAEAKQLTQKLAEQKRRTVDREKKIEAVLEEELRRQRDEFASEVAALSAAHRTEVDELRARNAELERLLDEAVARAAPVAAASSSSPSPSRANAGTAEAAAQQQQQQQQPCEHDADTSSNCFPCVLSPSVSPPPLPPSHSSAPQQQQQQQQPPPPPPPTLPLTLSPSPKKPPVNSTSPTKGFWRQHPQQQQQQQQ
eukprot:Rhum_TRINITY_DN12110_c0_g2::Rhum_TRINITY_DN12110_c0_g2_i1::g.49440::m.49440/K10396/KIF5; kinesin family member 5